MKKIVCLVCVIALAVCLFGCESSQPAQDDVPNNPKQSIQDNRKIETMGVSFEFTPNSTWIKNINLTEVNENYAEISYYDSILEGNCKMIISKETPISLSQYGFSNSHDQTWQAVEKQVAIKLQQDIKEKVAVATWEYEDFHFAIIGENVSNNNSTVDSIPKTAIYIINSMEIID